MDAQQFAYWLQGFAELNEVPPTPEQWQSIRDHLATVFVKVTPLVHTPSQMWPATVTPLVQPTTADKPFMHELIRSECKASPAGDGDTVLC